jgi:hypothetical protein
MGRWEGVDLARHLGVAAVRPFGTLLRFDRAPEQGRILRRKPAELKLHGGDLGTLLGELLLEAIKTIGNRAVRACRS